MPYTRDEEEKIRTQALVREWQRSGFLEPSQIPKLEADLKTDFRRTNFSFRILLSLFAVIIVAASLVLIATVFHLDKQSSMAWLCLTAGILCVLTAHFLINRFRLYQFGVEESLACTSVVLFAIAAALMAPVSDEALWGLCVAAIGCLGVYLWFGYIGMALASIVCLAAIPFTFAWSSEMQRVVLAAIFVLILFLVRRGRLSYGDDFPGNHYGLIQAAAWAGLYSALNLQIGYYRGAHESFYWSTYGMTFILPTLGFRGALRDKDRYLIHASLVMALVTLGTNKPYLGLPRKPWDPVLFGLFLMGCAIVLRRWLSKGEHGQRYGFTATRLLASEQRILSVVATVSAALHQPNVSTPGPAPSKLDPGGGRSGGAGASGSF